MRKVFYVLLFWGIFNSTFAQEQDSLLFRGMEEVVVTGQYKPQSIKNSVYQVRTISNEQIQRQAGARLQDVLNTQLNIRFSQDVATGGSDINMMGLSGQNVKILIDGAPMIGRQGTSNEININQIELNSIERIEIIEGPMSVIYGADALAGVINIITKKSAKTKLSVSARLHEETIGKEYGIRQGIHNQYIGVSGNYKKWFASANVGRNLFNGWKDSAKGRELLWHKKDQLIANVVAGYRTENGNIYYRLDGLDEIITNPSNPTTAQPGIDQDYMTKRLMHQIQGNYQFSSKLTANALASYTRFSRQVYSTLYYPDGDIRVATAPGLHSFSTFYGFTFRATAVYQPIKVLSFQPGIDVNLEKGDGERIKTDNQSINDYAFFLTSEYKPNGRINLRPGVRFIKNSVYQAPPVVPSINAKFGLTKELDFRVAYARGFRSPSIRELYFDFFDASHNIVGNQNLEAEHSNSFTGSLNWNLKHTQKTKLGLSLTGFYNDVDNMISYAPDAANPAITTYVNIDKYKTRGGSLGLEWHQHAFKTNMGFGYTGRFNEYREAFGNLAAFQWSPEVNATLSYAFTNIGLDLNLFYKFTGRLPYYQLVNETDGTHAQLVETSGYHWADITVNKKLFKLLTVNAGIRNLFDVSSINNSAVAGGAHSTEGARPIGYGRSYFLGLSFNWSKN